jgi:hypothetical protein
MHATMQDARCAICVPCQNATARTALSALAYGMCVKGVSGGKERKTMRNLGRPVSSQVSRTTPTREVGVRKTWRYKEVDGWSLAGILSRGLGRTTGEATGPRLPSLALNARLRRRLIKLELGSCTSNPTPPPPPASFN